MHTKTAMHTKTGIIAIRLNTITPFGSYFSPTIAEAQGPGTPKRRGFRTSHFTPRPATTPSTDVNGGLGGRTIPPRSSAATLKSDAGSAMLARKKTCG